MLVPEELSEMEPPTLTEMMDADEIIVLKDGHVDKQGSREEIYPQLLYSEAVGHCEGTNAAEKGGDAEC